MGKNIIGGTMERVRGSWRLLMIIKKVIVLSETFILESRTKQKSGPLWLPKNIDYTILKVAITPPGVQDPLGTRKPLLHS